MNKENKIQNPIIPDKCPFCSEKINSVSFAEHIRRLRRTAPSEMSLEERYFLMWWKDQNIEEPEIQTCDYCNGKGYIEGTISSRKCVNCDGIGKVVKIESEA